MIDGSHSQCICNPVLQHTEALIPGQLLSFVISSHISTRRAPSSTIDAVFLVNSFSLRYPQKVTGVNVWTIGWPVLPTFMARSIMVGNRCWGESVLREDQVFAV